MCSFCPTGCELPYRQPHKPFTNPPRKSSQTNPQKREPEPVPSGKLSHPSSGVLRETLNTIITLHITSLFWTLSLMCLVVCFRAVHSLSAGPSAATCPLLTSIRSTSPWDCGSPPLSEWEPLACLYIYSHFQSHALCWMSPGQPWRNECGF